MGLHLWGFNLAGHWLIGMIMSLFSAVASSLGLVLQKKAQYRLMGAANGEDDPIPSWRRLLKTRIFWLGLTLYLTHDFLNMIALSEVPGDKALPLDRAVFIVTGFLLSHIILFEPFTRTDLAAATCCSICMASMSRAMSEVVPMDWEKNSELDHYIGIVENHTLGQARFSTFVVAWIMAVLMSTYLAMYGATSDKMGYCMLAGLASAPFRLSSRVCSTLIYHLRDKNEDVHRIWHQLVGWSVVTILCFLFHAGAVCEGLRHVPCRLFLPALIIIDVVITSFQDFFFFGNWESHKLSTDWAFVIIVSGVVALGSLLIIDSKKAPTLFSVARGSPLLQHKFGASIRRIMDEYKMIHPEAQHPLKLQLVDLPLESFRGTWQRFPIFFFIFLFCLPIVLTYIGWKFTAFTCCTVFSVLQSWKMSLHVPLFAYLGIQKMRRYTNEAFLGNGGFKAMYDNDLNTNDELGGVSRMRWEDVIHVIVLPNYEEPIEDLHRTLESIKASPLAKCQIVVLLAMEEAEEGVREKAKQLIDKFGSSYRCICATFHPKVLGDGVHPEREAAGKSANAQWAASRLWAALRCSTGQNLETARQNGLGQVCGQCLGCCCGAGKVCAFRSAADPRDDRELKPKQQEKRSDKAQEIANAIRDQDAEIQEQLGRALCDSAAEADTLLGRIVLTVADADSEFHTEFFSALTYGFVNGGGAEGETPSRYLSLWQPPIIHYKNYLEQIFPVRFASVCTSLHELANLADPNATRVAYSTYSLSATLARAMDGWDPNWITEDWHTTLKLFLTTGGRFRVLPIFYPIVNTVPTGNTFCEAVNARWEQAKRHAYGISELVFMQDHAARVYRTLPTTWMQAVFVWRFCFIWFKAMFIHVFIAILPAFAFYNTKLLVDFEKHKLSQNINSWTFLVNFCFQILGVIAACGIFIVGPLLFEAVKGPAKPCIDGVYSEGGTSFHPNLPLRFRRPGLHTIVFALQSLIGFPFVLGAFSFVEWRAALMTALTKGGAFTYVTASEGARQAAGTEGAGNA